MKLSSSIFLTLILIKGLSAQEICNNGIDDDGDGLIDCYDFECIESSICLEKQFFISPSYSDPVCRVDLPGTDILIDTLWRSPNLEYIIANSSFVAGDIDGNKIPEIVAKGFSTTGEADSLIVILDGKTGQIKTTLNIRPYIANLSNGEFLALGDIDNDGLGELIIEAIDPTNSNKKHLLCYENDGLLKWVTSDSIPYDATIGLADFNGDGTSEIYYALRIYDATNGNLLAKGSDINIPSYGSVLAADVLPDSYCPDCDGLEIMSGSEVYSVTINGGTSSMTLRNSITGFPALINVADYDGDNSLDIILQGNPIKTYGLLAWNPRSGNQFASSGFASLPPPDPGCFLSSADFDHDDTLEFLVTNRWWITLFDSDFSTIIWRRNKQDFSGCASSSLFDFNCDGELEVLVRDQATLKIFNGLTGQTYDSVGCLSGTASEYPLIADIDNNGSANILCGCAKGTGDYSYILSYKAPDDNWASSRSIWNQYMYHNTNINDDLSIPKKIQSHSNTPQDNLNGFSIQSNLLDENYQSKCYKELNDFSVAIDSIDSCSGFIRLSVCNNGPLFCYTTNLNLYDSVQNRLLFVDSIPSSVKPDTCYSFDFTITKNSNYNLFTSISYSANDNTFTFDTTVDCDLSNNLSSRIAAITIFDTPALSNDIEICEEDSVIVFANVHQVDYLWSDSTTDSILLIKSPGIYWLAISSMEQCHKRDSFEVNAVSCEITKEQDTIYILNAFSPNGDGINDLFGINTNRTLSEDFLLRIYNRYGTLLFESTSSDEKWDGTYRSTPLQYGNYIYSVSYKDVFYSNGSVTLLR